MTDIDPNWKNVYASVGEGIEILAEAGYTVFIVCVEFDTYPFKIFSRIRAENYELERDPKLYGQILDKMCRHIDDAIKTKSTFGYEV